MPLLADLAVAARVSALFFFHRPIFFVHAGIHAIRIADEVERSEQGTTKRSRAPDCQQA
jgi:hypothetical protein